VSSKVQTKLDITVLKYPFFIKSRFSGITINYMYSRSILARQFTMIVLNEISVEILKHRE